MFNNFGWFLPLEYGILSLEVLENDQEEILGIG